MTAPPTLSRRSLLQGGAALVVSFAFGPGGGAAAQGKEASAPAKSVDPDEVGGFLAIDAQGRVTLYSGKVELGTGVLTALTQIVAEELDVPLERVRTVQGDTLLTPDQQPTYASLSIQVGGMQIRKAAATARAALLAQAATRLGVPIEQLAVQDGTVAPRAGGAGITYAALLQGRGLAMKLDPAARTKDPKDYRIVGKPVQRLDIPAKIFGSFEFVHDVRLPGMVHARVLHPAAVGATLESWDDTPCKGIPGYLRAVRQGNLLAVVASDEWAAVRASRALVAKWSAGEGLPDDTRLVDWMRSAKVDRDEVLQRTAGPAAPPAPAGRPLSASYDMPLNTHGSIGPSCAVADFKDGALTVWTPAQGSHMLRRQLATMLGLAEANVRCIYVEGAGCYGRNGADDCASEAALIAVQVGGTVRLQWMRADEHGWDPKGPPTLMDYRASLDPQGRVGAWEADIFLPERPMKRSGVTLLAAVLAGLPREGPDTPGTYNPGLGVPYDLPGSTLTAHWLHDAPLPAAWIRAPGRMQNTFGNESFIDQLAAAAGVDPLAFRIRHLSDPRGLALLERLRAFSGWQPRGARARDSGPLARGRGISYAKYELVRTYVALVADVAVDRRSGQVHVERVFVVHDCGQIINPDGLRNQIEGNVVQTVSRTLVERLRFDRQAVTSLDWAGYPILTFPEVPQVSIELIDRPAEPPWGAGEPTTSAVPSAIANAVFDATGAQLRSVPFRPASVLAALAAVATPTPK